MLHASAASGPLQGDFGHPLFCLDSMWVPSGRFLKDYKTEKENTDTGRAASRPVWTILPARVCRWGSCSSPGREGLDGAGRRELL